jgi:2-polyprenyl-6-methoxyphenol hydroxylase-like FAD-dependent oxidoreductase
MKAILIGAGNGGLSTAIVLRKIGMAVKFFESKHEVRFAGAGLRVSSNAFQALQHLGIGDQVIQEGKVLDELRILLPAEKILQRTDTASISRKYGLDNIAIERGKVLELLTFLKVLLRGEINVDDCSIFLGFLGVFSAFLKLYFKK